MADALAPHRSVQATLTRALAGLILSGELPEGSLLPNESLLMARYGMSRTVLREAIKTLTAKGLLESRARIGTRVLATARWHMFDPDLLAWRMALGLDPRFLSELFEVRRALEPTAAACAARRHLPVHLDRMEAALADMARPTHTPQSFAEADLAFHLAVLDAADNTLMRGIGAVIEAALASSFTLSSPVDEPQRHLHSVTLHRAIAAAVAAGDAPGAAAAMEAVILDPAVRNGWISPAMAEAG